MESPREIAQATYQWMISGHFLKNLNDQDESGNAEITFENPDKNSYVELKKELKAALKSLKNNKATGEDLR